MGMKTDGRKLRRVMSGVASEEESIWSAPGLPRVGERIHATDFSS